MAKLTDAQKQRIFELRALGWSQRAIGAEVGCAQSVVGLVLNPELAEGKRTRNRAYARQRYLDKTEEERERARAWRAANPEKAREANRDWHRANRAYHREYWRARPEAARAEARRYRARYPEKVRERQQSYYLIWREDPENMRRMRDRVRAWKRQNPVAVKASIQRRRGNASRGMDATDRILSVEYRKALARDACAYCGAPGEHTDHMTPIARNGTDHWWNLQRTCQRCNHRKGTMTHEEFLASGRLRRASGVILAERGGTGHGHFLT